MPRPKRKGPERRGAADYTNNDRVIAKLLDGSDFAFLDDFRLGPDEHKADESERATLATAWSDAWVAIGEELTRLHVFGSQAEPAIFSPFGRQNAQPGTRPWGWWNFDAPEPRGGGETEFAYLDRLDLLLPGERELIERA